MFHNVLMTSLTPLRDIDEIHCWDNRPFARDRSETKHNRLKDNNIKKTIKKKNKRNRTIFTTEQLRVLEKIFARSKYIDVERRKEIAECLRIEQKCVKTWFQNRRMKEKKELSESGGSDNEVGLEPSSLPLETAQPSSTVPDNLYSHSHADAHVRPLQPYNYATNNYLNTEATQNNSNSYETPNNHCAYKVLNPNVFRNCTEYSYQYYPPQTENGHYYNTGYIENQYITNVQDWHVNNYDPNYM